MAPPELAGVDIAHDLVELFLADLGALLRIGVEGVADFYLFYLFEHALDEFVVDFGFDEEAAAGAAALALVEEEGEVRAFDGGVEIGIGEDDVGAFAAEFEGDAFEVGASGGLHDELSDFGAAGEGDFVDVGMLVRWRRRRFHHSQGRR